MSCSRHRVGLTRTIAIARATLAHRVTRLLVTASDGERLGIQERCPM